MGAQAYFDSSRKPWDARWYIGLRDGMCGKVFGFSLATTEHWPTIWSKHKDNWLSRWLLARIHQTHSSRRKHSEQYKAARYYIAGTWASCVLASLIAWHAIEAPFK